MADREEYQVTTSRRFEPAVETFAPLPDPPEGEGWKLVSSVPVASGEKGLVFYWTWARTVRRPQPECPNPKCTSIAQKDGKCLGCGTPFPLPQ